MSPRIAGPICLGMFFLATVSAGRAQEKEKDSKEVITPAVKEAVHRGVSILAKEQAEDGSWGSGSFRGNIGVTSLCGLAFLATGQGPGKEEPGKNVEQAIGYLLGKEHRGMFQPREGTHGPMYGQGYATLFLAEAVQVLPKGDIKDKARKSLERAVKLIVSAQNKEGGWRYQPRPGDADISVTVCQVHALRAARRAGVEVPKEVFEKAEKYVLDCRDPASGGFRYRSAAGPVGFARTAAALSALHGVGGLDADSAKKGFEFLTERKAPRFPDEVEFHYFYGRYYATQAIWLAGKENRRDWYIATRDELLKRRKENGTWFDDRMDPHYCTAMAVLTLQVPEARLSVFKSK